MSMRKSGDYHIEGTVSFIGIVLISNYDRIGIYLIYHFFRKKILNHFLQKIISVGTLFVGTILFLGGLMPSLIERPLLLRIPTIGIPLLILVFSRWVSVKSDYYWFPLDKDFFDEK
jgi:hypothetical protein